MLFFQFTFFNILTARARSHYSKLIFFVELNFMFGLRFPHSPVLLQNKAINVFFFQELYA